MKRIITLSILIILTFLATSACAGSIFYNKPEFRGRIIDAETKEPIEGAVAVVLYDKWPMIGGPGGPNSYTFHAKETLTNNKGEFSLPSYSSLTLSSMDAGVTFIFYKPGYMASYGLANISPLLTEAYFSTGKISEEMEITGRTFDKRSYIKWKGPMGIVELKRAETSDERRIGVPSTPMDYTSKDLPLLFKTINADRKERGSEVRENE